MPEISDITPDAQQANDRLLVRRGASPPHTLALLNAMPESPSLLSVATQIIKGRTTGGTGPVEDLTPTQVTAMLDVFTSLLKGLVPSGGTVADVLRGDASWGEAPSNAELVAGRLGRASLSDLNRASLVMSCGHFVKPSIGRYAENRFNANSTSTLVGVANRIDLVPWMVPYTYDIDQFGVEVSTLIASALGKVVIYSADAEGKPDALLYESGNLDFGSTGYKFANPGITLQAGTLYWFGIRESSTATLRRFGGADAIVIGRSSGAGTQTTSFTMIRRTVTFANPAPDPWVHNNSEYVANVAIPTFRWRASS